MCVCVCVRQYPDCQASGGVPPAISGVQKYPSGWSSHWPAALDLHQRRASQHRSANAQVAHPAKPMKPRPYATSVYKYNNTDTEARTPGRRGSPARR